LPFALLLSPILLFLLYSKGVKKVLFSGKFRSNPMVRLSKVTRMRAVSYKRPAAPAKKTGAKKLAKAFKEHKNAFEGELAQRAFLPKIQ
jgi:hypothetical protein